MHDSAEYRVMNRKNFVVIVVILLSLVAVGVWVGLDSLAEHLEQLEEFAAAEPLEARAILTQLWRSLAILNGIVLSFFAALIIWHGWRGWRTASMPPKGSWILEGQRTWAGDSAVRIAKFTIVVGGMLAVLGVASSFILWGVGDSFMNQTSEQAASPPFPLHQRSCP